ncbi:MAG: rhodanese-like domain-containing protein [Phycisphaeraceae bacterium]|nr:rhodanese-like domain-containing protein [Phycisphaeraceae bacterium]
MLAASTTLQHRTLTLIGSLALLLLVVGCDKGMKINDRHLRNVSFAQLQALADLPDGQTLLLDARAPKDFLRGHLPGAVNAYLPDIHEGDKKLEDAKYLIVYGQGWQDSLAPAVAKRLLAYGYDGVYLFRGGVTLWTGNGQPLVDAQGNTIESTPATQPTE